MEEGAHSHAHAPHRTGVRWLDMSLALSAFVVSLASLWLTVHNARTMERLVAAAIIGSPCGSRPARCRPCPTRVTDSRAEKMP